MGGHLHDGEWQTSGHQHILHDGDGCGGEEERGIMLNAVQADSRWKEGVKRRKSSGVRNTAEREVVGRVLVASLPV